MQFANDLLRNKLFLALVGAILTDTGKARVARLSGFDADSLFRQWWGVLRAS